MRAVTPKGIEMQDQDIRPHARHRGVRSLVDVWAGSRLSLGLVDRRVDGDHKGEWCERELLEMETLSLVSRALMRSPFSLGSLMRGE